MRARGGDGTGRRGERQLRWTVAYHSVQRPAAAAAALLLVVSVSSGTGTRSRRSTLCSDIERMRTRAQSPGDETRRDAGLYPPARPPARPASVESSAADSLDLTLERSRAFGLD